MGRGLNPNDILYGDLITAPRNLSTLSSFLDLQINPKLLHLQFGYMDAHGEVSGTQEWAVKNGPMPAAWKNTSGLEDVKITDSGQAEAELSAYKAMVELRGGPYYDSSPLSPAHLGSYHGDTLIEMNSEETSQEEIVPVDYLAAVEQLTKRHSLLSPLGWYFMEHPERLDEQFANSSIIVHLSQGKHQADIITGVIVQHN